MKKTLLVVLLATPLAAQPFYVYTPPAAGSINGNSSSTVLYGNGAMGYDSRTQQADSNWIGSGLLPSISAVAYRRDNTSNPAPAARTIDIEIRMSHANYATFGTTFANNPSDTPVAVLPRQLVNVPGFAGVPANVFDFDPAFPFAAPFVPNATDAILLDTIVFNTVAASNSCSQDWYSSLPTTTGYGQTHLDRNDGCTTTNGVFKAVNAFTSTTTTMTLAFSVTGGPASTAVSMLMGSPLLVALPVPGLCAPLGTDALLNIPIGSTDAAGVITPAFTVTGAFSAGLAGVLFSTQAAALDLSQAGIPVALSNSTLTSMPRTAGTPTVGIKRTFNNTDANGLTGTAVSTSGIPTRYSI